MRGLDVRRCDDALTVFTQAQCHLIAVLKLENHTLQVQQQVHDVLLHAVDGGVLVHNACDRDFRRSMTDH